MSHHVRLGGRTLIALDKDQTAANRLVALSTPHGARGWWWDAWTNGDNRWTRVQITAPQCPRISQSFLDEEHAALGDWLFRQEYLGEFVSTIDSVFATEDIDAALSDTVRPLFSGVA